ncbi:MAG: class I SAM-dependent methyltransferase [Myxococcales bacterium]|nr:class I SAM-dependent methyltransferase [Myxococcales bacterium]
MNDAVTVFGDWARAGRAEPMGRAHAPRATAALERLSVAAGQRVVDLGCGEGWASRWLAERIGPGGEAIGLDGSAAMLERARLTPRPHLRYIQGDLLALPFEDASVDRVFSMEALYYVPLDQALAEVFRVLRPGGSAAVCTDFYAEHEASHAWPGQLDLQMDLRSRAQWEEALTRAGFEAVVSERIMDPERADHAGTLAVFGRRPSDR